jgi:magnesium-transporting ATPase (P-type)
VQLVMLTGDNVKTAQTIALKAGLTGQIVAFSRLPATFSLQNLAGIAEVKPEDKLAIVQRLQASGHIVGMTGDGVNDAPAIRQAEVGIAVENAVDLAKRAAKMILLEPGLTSIIEILDSGHRVYQRMMTWTITKLSRTAELTIILTLGYLLNHFLPLSLNAMILVAILNDLVTLVLGTDRTSISHHPENWHLGKLGFISGTLAIGWTLVGMIILTLLTNLHVAQGQISTIIFNYLIFSAMLTILITRSNRNFWRSKPSRAVMTAITINIVLTITLSLLGWGIVAIRATTIFPSLQFKCNTLTTRP